MLRIFFAVSGAGKRRGSCVDSLCESPSLRQWRSIIPTSSCAASFQASQSGDFVRNVSCRSYLLLKRFHESIILWAVSVSALPNVSLRTAGDGKCVVCDSYVRPATLVKICDECNYGSYQGRCVICGGFGVSDAYYCKECTMQEKDVRGPSKTFLLNSLSK